MTTDKAAWPKYEDGAQVQIGDTVKLPFAGPHIKVRSITFGGANPRLGCYVNGYWVGSDEHCERAANMLIADAYQLACLRTCPTDYANDVDRTLDMCAMGIAGEAGEVADLIKKVRYQGHDFDKVHFIKELGDVLYYLAVAAYAVDVSLTDVMQTNVAKLQKRYPDGFSADRSVNREEGDV